MYAPEPADVRAAMAGDIHAIMDRFGNDRFWAVTYWDAYRDKTPMLDICASQWQVWPADVWLQLTPKQLTSTYALYDALARFRLWVQHTEAMPATLEARYDAAHETLIPLAEAALEALGPVILPKPDWVMPSWGDLRRAPPTTHAAPSNDGDDGV